MQGGKLSDAQLLAASSNGNDLPQVSLGEDGQAMSEEDSKVIEEMIDDIAPVSSS